MNAFVVWLDQEEAKFFELAPEGLRLDHLRAKESFGLCDRQRGSQIFFCKLADYLTCHAGDILLLGRGAAKDEFYNYVLAEGDHGIAKKVIGVKEVAEPTECAITRVAKEFFKRPTEPQNL